MDSEACGPQGQSTCPLFTEVWPRTGYLWPSHAPCPASCSVHEEGGSCEGTVMPPATWHCPASLHSDLSVHSPTPLLLTRPQPPTLAVLDSSSGSFSSSGHCCRRVSSISL